MRWVLTEISSYFFQISIQVLLQLPLPLLSSTEGIAGPGTEMFAWRTWSSCQGWKADTVHRHLLNWYGTRAFQLLLNWWRAWKKAGSNLVLQEQTTRTKKCLYWRKCSFRICCPCFSMTKKKRDFLTAKWDSASGSFVEIGKSKGLHFSLFAPGWKNGCGGWLVLTVPLTLFGLLW